jgi:hypothetical protein
MSYYIYDIRPADETFFSRSKPDLKPALKPPPCYIMFTPIKRYPKDRRNTMKNLINRLTVQTADTKKVRIAFFVLTLVLFILSAGAPDASGGIIN